MGGHRGEHLQLLDTVTLFPPVDGPLYPPKRLQPQSHALSPCHVLTRSG